MTQISSVDFDNKRVHLHADTVTAGFDAWLAIGEIKALFVANANDEQNRAFFIEKRGYINKGGGRFTPKYVYSFAGWRFVPYNAVSHRLLLKTEIVSADQISDDDVFDLSSLAVNVHITVDYQQTEIREINTGSGLSAQQSQELDELHAAHFNRRELTGDTITLYADDGITPIKTFTTNSDLSSIDPNV